MKIRLTEEQLRYIIKESVDANVSPEALANSLMSDHNNEIVWIIYPHENENGIFSNGFSPEYSGDREGTYHGRGQYCFYKPYGPNSRMVQAGGVRCNLGDRIAKCVLLNGFKNCLIFDRELAIKYYNSPNFLAQLRAIFDNERLIQQMYAHYCHIAHDTKGEGNIPYTTRPEWTTSYLSASFNDRFGKELRSSKCRGVVYNGGNDHYAAVMFNRRDFIPMFSTKSVTLRNPSANDFDNWEFKFTKDEYEKIKNFGDFESAGNIVQNIPGVKNVVKEPPRFGFVRVVLENGKKSFYDLKHEKLVLKSGFDQAICFEKDNDGDVVLPCVLTIKGRQYEFIMVPQDGEYIFGMFNQNGEFTPRFTAEQYDKLNGSLNESVLNEWGYHEIYPERDTQEQRNEISSIMGLSCNLESIYQGVKDQTGLEGVIKHGFDPQYSYTECYGHGVYTCLTLKDSIEHISRPRIVHAYIKDGFKNFIIMERNLAQKYYGEFNPLNQFRSLIRPEYKQELEHKYYRITDNFINDVFSDLGKTNIRGIIYWYSDCWATVICDWKCSIPYEYSTDMGKTWKMCLDNELKHNMDEHRDGFFMLLPFIQDEIIEDSWGIKGVLKAGNGGQGANWRGDIKLHPKFINKHLKVKLKSNGNTSFINTDGKLISKYGFKQAIGFQRDDDGDLLLPCEININGKILEMLCVKSGKDYILGFINKNGEFIQKCTLDQLDKAMKC